MVMDMETHIFAIIGPGGEVLATTGVEGWVERMAPVLGGVPVRFLCGAWVPMG